MAAAKVGDATKCSPSVPAAEKNKYCNTEFDTEPDMNKDCKNPEDYCMMCCENEIGVKHIKERGECLK